tara:strand:+ start:5938 stop:6126 length:189 start_codon:yes stop_codon:yes gene_type:complete
MAPGVTEQRDLRHLAEDLMSSMLYRRRDVCKQEDCSEGERPAHVTVTIQVDHRAKEKKNGRK